EILPIEKKTKDGTSPLSHKEIKCNHESIKEHSRSSLSPKQLDISPNKQGSVTISLAAYRRMKEKKDVEKQAPQDDRKKNVSSSELKEKKRHSYQTHNGNKEKSRERCEMDSSANSRKSNRRKGEAASATLNVLSVDEQNSCSSGNIKKQGNDPHPLSIGVSRKEIVESSRLQTNSTTDGLSSVKSLKVKKNSNKLVTSSQFKQHSSSLGKKSSTTICGPGKKRENSKVSSASQQQSVSHICQDKDDSSNRKSPRLERLSQTPAKPRKSESDVNGDVCKSSKLSFSDDHVVNLRYKNEHSGETKVSKLVSKNSSKSSSSLKIKIPKEKINSHNQDSKSAMQHRKDLTIPIPKVNVGVEESPRGPPLSTENSGSSGSTLKLVISKDRINSSSHSKTISKLEKESRKREHDPKGSTIKKFPKLSKLDSCSSSGQKGGQYEKAESVSNLNPLKKHRHRQNKAGHAEVPRGHQHTDEVG
ncbi:micronuclear linker histone polyprotein-like, partial [Limulus polyphemus]|uniref:Micronuclear linker histone polyprotein-like n=1 Tax=Limulus polyphemus TaxID=6850 RepID=A0ABM1RY12_LIMPO